MNDLFGHLFSNIKVLRTTHHEKQSDLAKVVDKLNTTISNWELGIRIPEFIDVIKIAKHYNVSVDDLIHKDFRFEKITYSLDDTHNLTYADTDNEELLKQHKDELIDIIDKNTD